MTETMEPYTTGEAGDAKLLTYRQRFVARMLRSFANDLDLGTLSEQHTAALLRMVADAAERGYELDMVTMVRVWRMGVEREGTG